MRIYKILILDDKEFISAALTRVVRGQRFVLYESSCDNEAVEIARKIHPHVVLLNCDMSNTGNWNVSDRGFADIMKGVVTILYSGSYKVRREFIIALLSGVGFLLKPYAFTLTGNSSGIPRIEFLYSWEDVSRRGEPRPGRNDDTRGR